MKMQRVQRAALAPAKPSPQEVATLRIVGLYKSLEAAMTARGVPRHLGTPPLAHAHALADMRHPIASEVLQLTEIYQQARFGGRQLDEAQGREFATRVRALRQSREPDTRQAA